MSTAFRASKTGEGDQTGLRGSFATEMWIVQVDNEFQDPLPVIARFRPLGSEHTDVTLRAAHVVDYQKVEKTDNPLTWRILVIYQTNQLLGGGSFGGWRVATRWETRTEHLTRSLPTLDKLGKATDDGKLIGPHHYRVFDPDKDESFTHLAPDPTTGTDIKLVQTDGIRPVGFDRIAPAMHITFSATVPNMSFALLRYLQQKFAGRVNATRWKGFAPNTLLFTGFSEDEQASIETQATSRTDTTITPTNVYPVNVEFAFNSEGWTPVKFVDTYTTPGGIETAVRQIVPVGVGFTVLVFSEYRVYESASLGDVFTLLGSGTVPSDPKKGWHRP